MRATANRSVTTSRGATPPRARSVVHVDVLDKTALESAVEHVFSEHPREAFEIDDVDTVHDHVARVAAPEALIARDVVLLNENIHHFLGAFQFFGLGEAPEDMCEFGSL